MGRVVAFSQLTHALSPARLLRSSSDESELMLELGMMSSLSCLGAAAWLWMLALIVCYRKRRRG